MERNRIDASLGLAIAIDMLRQHRQTGELQGRISISRFLKTNQYLCVIRIENGRVASCSVIDEQGNKQAVEKEFLIQMDQKRGPFEWTFYPQEVEYSPAPAPIQSRPMLPAPVSAVSNIRDDAIPVRLVPELQLSWLTTWQEYELKISQQIFSLINGRRTVREIKALMFRCSPDTVEKALIFLIAMKQVEMMNTRGKL